MKILVTGANGYLGRGIVESLLELNHEIHIADINNRSDLNLKSYNCDIFSIEDPYNFSINQMSFYI